MKTNIKTHTVVSKMILKTALLIVALSSCQKSASSDKVALDALMVQKSVNVSLAPAITGPDVVGVAVSSNYELILPVGLTVATATWNFGDGSTTGNGAGPLSHAFMAAGLYELNVQVRDTNSNVYDLVQTVNVLADSAQLACVSQASVTIPREVNINSMVPITGNIPTCLQGDLTGIKIDYGDGTVGTNLSSTHSYLTAGTFQVTIDINTFFQDDPTKPYIRLSQTILVSDPAQNCSTAGATRTSYSDPSTETLACGLSGTKSNAYKTRITEQCQSNNGSLQWMETSRVSELQTEGTCQGQSCLLPDSSVLADGGSKTLYTTSNPVGLCSSESSTRVCNNGVLSGSSNYSVAVCHDGCGDFGANGTVKNGVVTGETKTALKCSFEETGFFNTFNQISDKKCSDGQIIITNTRQGELKSADVCPVYHWQATESWSACSADCGGQQSRTFICQDNNNVPTSADRCTTVIPKETRICDGNPAAMARVEKTEAEEEGGSSTTCPKNQIGVITNSRTATTVKTFACLQHSVQVAEQHTEYTAWVKNTYCRDYVAYRCSQDSLSNSLAVERYKWLVKCADTVPVIKDFLTNFADVKGSKTYTINATARVLYPTFMVHDAGKEKVWIAPTSQKAACTVPANAYIAAVCVSSCATPEQQILAQAKQNDKNKKYMSFIDALTSNADAVGTLSIASDRNTKEVKTTRVDQWVTEMIDTEHDILEFRMKSGRTLKVTPNHPIVADSGAVELAETFKVGDNVVQLGGAVDPILEINKLKYFGKVYNLFVKSSAPLENIVVTNGYLNGTAFYQNEGSANINRVLLRQKLIKAALTK